MNNNPQVFHGEWWVPAKADPSNHTLITLAEGMEKKYTGTLTYYGNKNSMLELYHVPSNFCSRLYHHNNVMWGMDANGKIFTLFNVVMKEQHLGDFTHTTFVVDLILVGEQILYNEDISFCSCIVKFPYLRNWAFHNKINIECEESRINFNLDVTSEKLAGVFYDEGIYWNIWQGSEIERTIHDLKITTLTTLEIESTKPYSIWMYLKHIEEFAQFLSISLYGEQKSIEIKFWNKEKMKECFLLFKKDISVDPGVFTLIKFEKLKDKLPSMLHIWHDNFEKITPISSYLIKSLQKKNKFDVSDFLIIAQALDGYHKRFVNKKKGKDIRKYEEQIEILLNQFKDVEVIKQCKINPLVLKDTRHKYSHLYPDDEESLAVTDGGNLYWLTEKCKILLTCCILNLLGLTNEEINLCCEKSPISQIIDSLPPEIDLL